VNTIPALITLKVKPAESDIMDWGSFEEGFKVRGLFSIPHIRIGSIFGTKGG
jgi:hypothetical protein